MKIIEKQKQKTYTLDAKEIELDNMSSLGCPLAKKILRKIINEEKYPKQIARELKENEQKIYYHIRNLERSGIIKITKSQTLHGTIAKFYKVIEPAIVIKFKELEKTDDTYSAEDKVSSFLSPFITDGKLNAKIIVGSPDPHGPEKARSRDGHYATDLALFLGTFLDRVTQINVKLDTETTEDDIKENLILIGGPIINRITERFNSSLPIQFSQDKTIYSKISKTRYSSDETGIIVKIKNPFDNEKSVLIVAGKRFSGTRAAVIAFFKEFKSIYKGNKFKPSTIAKVVEGLDLDSDGIIDSIEFRE